MPLPPSRRIAAARVPLFVTWPTLRISCDHPDGSLR
jgi:hypothetical protein